MRVIYASVSVHLAFGGRAIWLLVNASGKQRALDF